MLSCSFRYQAGTAVALALVANASAAAAPAPVVDTTSTSISSNVSREQLENLPAGRRVEDLIGTCPSNTFPTISRKPGVLIDGEPVIDLNCVQPADIEMIEVYKAHNAARAEYGAPPLVRDPLLELSAGEYVGQLARGGKLQHESREGRGTVRENLSQGMAGWSVGQLLGSWKKEKQNFVPGTFPNVSRTGNWYDIGHWAQMIWISTVLIGCARAAGIGSTWLVCRYDPGGNKDGKTVGLPPPRPYLIEAPSLPTTEVFGQNTGQPKTSALRTTTASDAGFDIHKAVTDALFKEVNGSVSLIGIGTTASYVDAPVETWGEFSTAADLGYVCRRASMFDLGIYGGGAYTTDWFTIGDDGELVDTKVEQQELPTTEVYNRAPAGSPTWSSPAPLYPDGPDPPKMNFGVETNVEKPELPTKEFYNPADAPNCVLDVM